MEAFKQYLCEEEKSHITIDKYMRDIRAFAEYVGEREICKNTVLAYKEMPGGKYAVTSANSMLAPLLQHNACSVVKF